MKDLKKEISELFVKYGLHTSQIVINKIVERILEERKKTLEEVIKEIVAEDTAVWKSKIGAKTERRLSIKDVYNRISKLKV